eukprot:gnl/TRDRNA2_/TRDRNA2_88025_c0_seq2.p1 gnl/TRDRNA2_/TRDRNA2_88025_c0~~gnl/TRDRNA2_/TRDRNA2_88025_c0_seq2.p1  ORF type:complete len:322 (-),score=35.85 gnl/TRDRNA2_/TRDRNA2_88025_c0_seq2:57-977(-)
MVATRVHFVLVAAIAPALAHLTQQAQKRILKEMHSWEQERKELEDCGIFVSWQEDLSNPVAMILGPADTPYAHGFFFFDVHFPSNYPMNPPQLKCFTGDGRVVLNTHLLENSPVCLSILGTYHGPPWSCACTLRTVLLSVQSLLTEHPLEDEPGYEQDDERFSEVVRYETIAVAVVRMLQRTPEKFKAFQVNMRQAFLMHLDSYLRTLEEFKPKDGSSTSFRSGMISFPVEYRTKHLIAELYQLKQRLLSQENSTVAQLLSQSPASAPASLSGPHPETSEDDHLAIGDLATNFSHTLGNAFKRWFR